MIRIEEYYDSFIVLCSTEFQIVSIMAHMHHTLHINSSKAHAHLLHVVSVKLL